MITALNKKHQRLVSLAYNYLAHYDQNNTLRDMASDNGDDWEYRRHDRICIKVFNKYLEVLARLPKREADRIEKIYYK